MEGLEKVEVDVCAEDSSSRYIIMKLGSTTALTGHPLEPRKATICAVDDLACIEKIFTATVLRETA